MYIEQAVPIFFNMISIYYSTLSTLSRAKGVLWPSIPNPGNSNAMQKIERDCELVSVCL